MLRSINFKFAIEQKVKVCCLNIVTTGIVEQRSFSENNKGIHIEYSVKINDKVGSVTPSEQYLVDTQEYPLGHEFK